MDEKDRNAYLIRVDDGVERSALPFVKLSYVPPSLNKTFRHFGFTKESLFSQEFAQWFDEHLDETFLEVTPMSKESFAILSGERDGDVTFFSSENLTAESSLETEGMNTHANKLDIKRTKRKTTLLHWVTNRADLEKWLKVTQDQMLVCHQWLDTHAHPGWYYPLADVYDDGETERKVLLRIHIPVNTKALRVPRFEFSMTMANFSEVGSWSHNDAGFGLEEVRLPPGSYSVVKVHPNLLYDDMGVCVVELLYHERAEATTQE